MLKKFRNVFEETVRIGNENIVSHELEMPRFKKLGELRMFRHEEARLKAFIAGERPVKIQKFMQELAMYNVNARRYGWRRDPEIKMFCKIMQDVLDEAPKPKKRHDRPMDAGEGARRFTEGITGRKVVQAPSVAEMEGGDVIRRVDPDIPVDLEYNQRLVQETADDTRWRNMLDE